MLKSVAWFVRPYLGSTSKYVEELDDNHKRLVEYAQTMERYIGPYLLKHNLHQAVCRLRDQCTQRGHIGDETEIQIERGVQFLKRLFDGSSVPFHVEHVTLERVLTIGTI